MRVPMIKNIYNLDYFHFTASAVCVGVNLWMLNDLSKQRERFENYKHEWYQQQLKNITKK